MKTAIVTGASGNLGQAIIKKLLQENYFVTGTVVPNHPFSTGINGKHFETAVVDLTKEDPSQQFVELVAMKHGTIDVAVLTVGGYASGHLEYTRTADVINQIQLNFETAYNVARPVFNQMIKQGSGRIFMIGSKPGLTMKNSKSSVAYGLAKSLIFRLAELMNEEAKGTGVVTSVIVPSTIDTPQNRKAMPDADPSKWVSPDSIAEIVSFYCSPEAEAMREPIIKIYGKD
jgi:NAD(P)-dependent dehydrogenase (short-subunit alcohol dehydrogenase family)